MDNFRPPTQRPIQQPSIPRAPLEAPAQRPLGQMPTQPAPTTLPPPQDIAKDDAGIGTTSPRRRKGRRILLWAAIVLLAACISAAVGGWLWYQKNLSPVNESSDSKTQVLIASGSSPNSIAATLKENYLIRNERAFLLYTKLEGVQGKLQAGTYRLSPSESVQQIVEHLTKGSVDSFDITFLPGATVTQNKQVFIKAGYEEAEIDAAFKKSYQSPLFAGKPADADLEGYIMGNTYRFGAGASVEEVLTHTFELFYEEIKKNDLEAKFAAQDLTLFKGITLASIVQRESIGGDEPQIAQVFFTRLAMGMPLGSDVTYQYAADKLGVPRDTNLDSPYNTRRYPGLPPGPIATPGIASLKAVASPAPGDYVYFLSGDDDVTYFGRTLAEHEANIRNHCQKKCLII